MNMLVRMKKCLVLVFWFFYFSNYSAKSKYHDDSSKLEVVKMEVETGGVPIIKFLLDFA